MKYLDNCVGLVYTLDKIKEGRTEMKITITEALAEIKTIAKRLDKKEEFISSYVVRDAKLVDPLDKEGGSRKVVESEAQSFFDLQKRLVSIRSAIQDSNVKTRLKIDNIEMSIAEWIVWKREVAPVKSALLNKMSKEIEKARSRSVRDVRMMYPVETSTASNDVAVCVDVTWLKGEIENLEKLLGDLDGKMSLVNATTLIELPD